MAEREITINSDLGLTDQALAVYAMLAGRELNLEGIPKEALIDVQARAWYNGREDGVCLIVRDWDLAKRFEAPDRGSERMVIAFGEHRSSDNIFVDCFLTARLGNNPPTYQDMTEGDYDRRRMFDYGRVDQVDRYIRNLIQEYLTNDMVALNTFVCRTCGKEGMKRDPVGGGKFCACPDRVSVKPPTQVLVPKSATLKKLR